MKNVFIQLRNEFSQTMKETWMNTGGTLKSRVF